MSLVKGTGYNSLDGVPKQILQFEVEKWTGYTLK